MDPTACLQDLLETLIDLDEDEDDEETREHALTQLQALTDWLKSGGFPPHARTAISEVVPETEE